MSNGTRPRVWSRPLIVWIWLVLLAAGSLGSSYAPLGAFNTTIQLGVAGIMVALLWLFLMELIWMEALVRLIALAGLVWISFMFALTLADYFSRS
jgi:caa(3)-type oxidase subunit IV